MTGGSWLAVEGLCRAYEVWLERRRQEIDTAVGGIRDISLAAKVRTDVADRNLNRLGPEVLARMRAGIETLKSDPVAFRCFRLANEAMHDQLVMATLQRRPSALARRFLTSPRCCRDGDHSSWRFCS